MIKEALKSSDDEFDPIIIKVMDAWNLINFVCKKYILNELDNILYDVYSLIMRGFELKVQSQRC